MNNNILKKIYFINLSYLIALSLYCLFKVGLFTNIPIHFQFDGEPNGFAPAVVAVAICPFVFWAIVKTATSKDVNGSGQIAVNLSLIALSIAHTAITLSAIAGTYANIQIIGSLLGLVVILLSNGLGLLARNTVVSIQRWWPQLSDGVLYKTQQFAGRLGAATGVAIILTVLFVRDHATAISVAASCLVLQVVGSLAYSYLAARREP